MADDAGRCQVRAERVRGMRLALLYYTRGLLAGNNDLISLMEVEYV